jgi:hypothetical protein
MFRLPTLTLVGQPWRAGEDEKLFWTNFTFDGLPFVLSELAVLETGRTLRGRNFQTGTDGRTRFQFKGIPEKAMVPGLHLYDASWPVRHERKAYLVPLGAQNQTVTATRGRLKGSLLPAEGVEVELKKIDAGSGKFLLSASSRTVLPCLVGQQYTLEPAGDPVLDTALVTCGSIEPRDLADFVKKTFRFPGLPTVNALYSIGLRVSGYTVLPPPLWEEEFEETVGKEGVRIMTKAWAHFAKKARNAAAQPGGIATDDLKKRMALPDAVFEFLTKKLVEDGELRTNEGFYLPVADPETYLSPIARKALSQLDERGEAGVDLENEPNALFKKTYQELARMGLGVATETPWVYGRAGWEALKAKLCGPGTLGREWRIADVKDLLSVSRKPILGILNRLETEGWLERREDHRLVVREAAATTAADEASVTP